jgi:glycosyltransferase involved in cell wall biosynthesis
VHVGLNLVFLVPGETGGMETYARELLPRLAARADFRLTAFVNRVAAAEPERPWGDLPATVVPVDSRNRIMWVAGEQLHLPRLAQAAGCDLVHSLASTAPLRGRFRRVTTIHDLHFKLVPDAHFGLRGLGMRMLVPGAARRSHRIVTDAQATADDLVEHLGVDRTKIDVVPLGIGTTARLAPTDTSVLRSRLDLGDRRVVLSLSAKRPHKNLPRLLDALALIPVERRPALILPGYPTPHEDELRERASTLDLTDDVRFVGWVDGADLEGLYALADCMCFPSLYEGFGLPVLEAMARGVPVCCSSRGALAEVAGDAALLFDPEDAAAIAAAVERILGDPAEAERLRAAGTVQAARFTWERTAAETVASYERALVSS